MKKELFDDLVTRALLVVASKAPKVVAKALAEASRRGL
jgi:hypothetical protein